MLGAFLSVLLAISQNNGALVVEESINADDVKIELCRVQEKEYVLILNEAEKKSVLIYASQNYGARNLYGELLLKYYRVKNKNKVVKEIDGMVYALQQDNARGLKNFFYSLTDIENLKRYSSFAWIDDNTGKREKVEGDEIGNNAGFFVQISTADYINFMRFFVYD